MSELMRLTEFIEIAGCCRATAYRWQANGFGPRMVTLNKRRMYRRADVRKFMDTLGSTIIEIPGESERLAKGRRGTTKNKNAAAQFSA